jgi:hypothetical protein
LQVISQFWQHLSSRVLTRQSVLANFSNISTFVDHFPIFLTLLLFNIFVDICGSHEH